MCYLTTVTKTPRFNSQSGQIICVTGLLVAYALRLLSDWKEGLTVSSIICDRWWHFKLVALKCPEGLGL